MNLEEIRYKLFKPRNTPMWFRNIVSYSAIISRLAFCTDRLINKFAGEFDLNLLMTFCVSIQLVLSNFWTTTKELDEYNFPSPSFALFPSDLQIHILESFKTRN